MLLQFLINSLIVLGIVFTWAVVLIIIGAVIENFRKNIRGK